jgi:hypothetical protein
MKVHFEVEIRTLIVFSETGQKNVLWFMSQVVTHNATEKLRYQGLFIIT